VGVCRRYFSKATAHLSATYGATLSKAFAFDMVRIGLGLYGYFPDGANVETQFPPLRRAMNAYAEIVCRRKYSFGGVGYGEMTERKKSAGEKFSVLRVGYAD
jgi:alanine racemase